MEAELKMSEEGTEILLHALDFSDVQTFEEWNEQRKQKKSNSIAFQWYLCPGLSQVLRIAE